MIDIFDILGHIMVGPSSSHTAGAVRIGNMGRTLLGCVPRKARLHLHGSFAETGAGHGTDKALVAGLLGLRPDSFAIPNSFRLAEEARLSFTFDEAQLKNAHPNTVAMELWDGEEKILESLYLAAGIGAVIAGRASISGAEGGCQAEIGAASAMAAGALVYLRGGTPPQICHAVAMALKNLLGLVCDPVAGLVEVPCIKRNVAGAMNAIAAADMALAGVESRIPVDEVIDAMGEVGRRLPVELRETALGGLADTPTGREEKARMRSNRKRHRILTVRDSGAPGQMGEKS